MSRVLVIAEHDGATLNAATARTVTAARALGDVDVAVFAADGAAVAGQAAALDGVTKVVQADAPANEHPVAAVIAPQIVSLTDGYSHVLAPSSTFGRDVLPRAAAVLGVQQVSDIMDVKDERTFVRPTYAGNVITTVKVPADGLVMGTVRLASYQPAGAAAAAAPIEAAAAPADLPTHTRYVGLEAAGGGDRPDLQSAPRVVSGGRGVGSAEGFEAVYKFADTLGAAVGASRAVVDAGFVPNDMQVGQTGKIIAPELYFAIGLSGAIQHVTGIKDAGTIVAINKDAEAPIFEIADFGLVGDLFDILPALEAEIDKG